MSNASGHSGARGGPGLPIEPGRLLHEITSLTEPIELARLFPLPQPVELELGAGDGSFLRDYAALHPERNFVGVERLHGRLGKIDRKGQRQGLTNVRGIRIEAGYFLRYLVPPGTLAALHVYFPDPWPKLRHRRRRLVNESFTRDAARALDTGGTVHVRTDSADYFAQMREAFTTNPDFVPVETPDELAAVLTDFERELNAQGRPTLRAGFRKVSPRPETTEHRNPQIKSL